MYKMRYKTNLKDPVEDILKERNMPLYKKFYKNYELPVDVPIDLCVFQIYNVLIDQLGDRLTANLVSTFSIELNNFSYYINSESFMVLVTHHCIGLYKQFQRQCDGMSEITLWNTFRRPIHSQLNNAFGHQLESQIDNQIKNQLAKL